MMTNVSLLDNLKDGLKGLSLKKQNKTKQKEKDNKKQNKNKQTKQTSKNKKKAYLTCKHCGTPLDERNCSANGSLVMGLGILRKSSPCNGGTCQPEEAQQLWKVMEWTQLTQRSGLEASSLAKTDSAVEALKKIRELFAITVENQTDTLDDLLAKRDLWRTLSVGR